MGMPYQRDRLDERKELFTECDPNGNYFLSLAEIDAVFQRKYDWGAIAPEIVNSHMLHAYDHARNYGGKEDGVKADYIEHKEFRIFMQMFVERMDGKEDNLDFGELDNSWKPE